MVYDIFNFFTGYVYIKINGVRAERVLNMGYTFWNVKRGVNGVYANVSYRSYKRLLKDESVSIELIEVKGVPALLAGALKNKVLFAGLAICFCAILAFSNMILGVEVNGYYSMKEEEVAKLIEDMGIKPFRFKQKVDLNNVVKQLIARDDIAWASAGYNGVILNIEIIEQVNENDNTPGDIVADRNALIKSIDVFAGIKNKQAGETVFKGDLLVAGVRQTETGVERIRARGKIMGTAWEKASHTTDMDTVQIIETGNTAKEEYLDFWGKKSFIKHSGASFEHYVVTKEEKYLGGGFIPIKYVNKVYNEVRLTGGENVESAATATELVAFEQAAKNLPEKARIVGKNTDYQIDENSITATVVLEYEIEIGVLNGGN